MSELGKFSLSFNLNLQIKSNMLCGVMRQFPNAGRSIPFFTSVAEPLLPFLKYQKMWGKNFVHPRLVDEAHFKQFILGRRKCITPETISELQDVSQFFTNWDNFSNNPEDKPTAECMWDLHCSLQGVIELAKSSPYAIRPDVINSDLVELHFSQVRELYHNRTPNVLQYRNVQNSIILGQPVAGANKKTNTMITYPKPFLLCKK